MNKPRTDTEARMLEVVLCPVCSCVMAQPRDPRVLPCQHTFCFQCLRRIVETAVLQCPICREEVTLTTTGVDGLKKSFAIKSMAEILLRQSPTEPEQTRPEPSAPPLPCETQYLCPSTNGKVPHRSSTQNPIDGTSQIHSAKHTHQSVNSHRSRKQTNDDDDSDDDCYFPWSRQKAKSSQKPSLGFLLLRTVLLTTQTGSRWD